MTERRIPEEWVDAAMAIYRFTLAEAVKRIPRGASFLPQAIEALIRKILSMPYGGCGQIGGVHAVRVEVVHGTQEGQIKLGIGIGTRHGVEWSKPFTREHRGFFNHDPLGDFAVTLPPLDDWQRYLEPKDGADDGPE